MKTKDPRHTSSCPRQEASSSVSLATALPGAAFAAAYMLSTQELGAEVSAVAGPTHRDSAPVASGDFDSMKFEEAFEAARSQVGPGGLFPWHGKVHYTYTPEEWESLDGELKAQFRTLMATTPVPVPEYEGPRHGPLHVTTSVLAEELPSDTEGDEGLEEGLEEPDAMQSPSDILALAEVEEEGGYSLPTSGRTSEVGHASFSGDSEGEQDGVELGPEGWIAPSAEGPEEA